MNGNRYQHVMKAIFGSPWAIYPPTLEMILDVVRFRAEGGQLTQDEITERIAGAENGPRTLAANGRGAQQRAATIALIPIYGIIGPRAAMFEQTSSGGTGVDQVTADFRAALADPEVKAICFDIDSPGGMVDGIEELAAEIRAARGTKPISAVANYMAASAAYYIAAQADEVVVSPSGQVGSIGVLTAHEDLSAMYEQQGIKTTIIKHGKYKAEANQFEPLSDEARAEIQGRVDEWGAMFEEAVAAGRGITATRVRKDFGQGRMMLAKAAKAAGLADRVDTLEGTIARLAKGSVKARPADASAAIGMRYIPVAAWVEREAAAFTEQISALAGTWPAETDARTTTTTTTITQTVTDDDDEQDPLDDPQDPQASANPTFSARLSAVTAEAAAMAAIAQSRAQRRTGRKPLSAAHRTGLETLRASLLATAAELEATLGAPDDAPRATSRPGPRLELLIAATRGGYRVPGIND